MKTILGLIAAVFALSSAVAVASSHKNAETHAAKGKKEKKGEHKEGHAQGEHHEGEAKH